MADIIEWWHKGDPSVAKGWSDRDVGALQWSCKSDVSGDSLRHRVAQLPLGAEGLLAGAVGIGLLAT